ncbi:hypothetical protein YPPY32_5079, partial [Yersinia pestis PY-32]
MRRLQSLGETRWLNHV